MELHTARACASVAQPHSAAWRVCAERVLFRACVCSYLSCSLDYPGIGPEHSFLRDIGRAEYYAVTDDEALEAFQRLSELEGIIPALETSHAIAYLEVRPHPLESCCLWGASRGVGRRCCVHVEVGLCWPRTMVCQGWACLHVEAGSHRPGRQARQILLFHCWSARHLADAMLHFAAMLLLPTRRSCAPPWLTAPRWC